MSKPSTRTEKDSLGIKEIPADVYYGIQTARAVENYPISGMRAHPALIRAIAMVKEAAAEANRELGLVDEKTADAIIQAAKEVQHGKWNHAFVVDVFQAGAGVSFHMNTNEVIANRASRVAGRQPGRVQARPSQRPRQLRPVHQRRLPHRDAPGHAAGAGEALSRARRASSPRWKPKAKSFTTS